MIATAPIHCAVPAHQPIVWAASRLEIKRTSTSGLTLTRLRLTTPDPIWSLAINVTGDDPDLTVGRCDAIVVADWYLLLRSDAQDWRLGTLHKHRLYHISSDGRVLWSHPWQIAGQIGLLGDRFVILRYLSTLYDSIGQPPVVAHLLDPRSGRSLLSHSIPIPNDLLPLYEQSHGSALSVKLEHNGECFSARISLFDAALALRGQALPYDGLFAYPLPFGQRREEGLGFVCPECLTPTSLRIVSAIQLPADSRSDEIALQIVFCQRCGFEGVAVYEESRRGALDRETWEHIGYRVSATVISNLRDTLKRCPHPKDAGCSCTAHIILNSRDTNGRWQKPDGVEWQKSFPMKLVR